LQYKSRTWPGQIPSAAEATSIFSICGAAEAASLQNHKFLSNL
jgi:hypothetical protein